MHAQHAPPSPSASPGSANDVPLALLLILPLAGSGRRPVRLDILVQAVGRQNFGCLEGGWDFKGLTSPEVKLDGESHIQGVVGAVPEGSAASR